MAPIDLKRSSVTVQRDATFVPAIEWNVDDIKFQNPAPVADKLFSLLNAALGTRVVRMGRHTITLDPPSKPSILTISVHSRGFQLQLVLKQDGAQDQVINFPLSGRGAWPEWIENVTEQIIRQAK